MAPSKIFRELEILEWAIQSTWFFLSDNLWLVVHLISISIITQIILCWWESSFILYAHSPSFTAVSQKALHERFVHTNPGIFLKLINLHINRHLKVVTVMCLTKFDFINFLLIFLF
jgi:hypothetical protein